VDGAVSTVVSRSDLPLLLRSPVIQVSIILTVPIDRTPFVLCHCIGIMHHEILSHQALLIIASGPSGCNNDAARACLRNINVVAPTRVPSCLLVVSTFMRTGGATSFVDPFYHTHLMRTGGFVLIRAADLPLSRAVVNVISALGVLPNRPVVGDKSRFHELAAEHLVTR